MNATTEILPSNGLPVRVAVTVTPLSVRGATASQIPAVPGCALVGPRSVQVKPPPATDEKLCPPATFGPSDATKATRWSLALVVVSGAEVMGLAAVD